ncbi:hypothetical protein ACG2LH_12550 [Zhouia sp. PK063]|uniref:hypothetical protein n=1 Tax=Zhouia sp. PK063 TaxID=3373602 RepID=UPI0037B2BC55
MRNLKMIKRTLLFGLLILTLNSCTESKKNSSEFIYENGNSSVELKILNGNDYLTYDTPIRMDFEWKNIDPKTASIFGVGIKVLGTKNGITKTEINVPSNYSESDTLNIKLRFEFNGEKIGTEFNVPLINKE